MRRYITQATADQFSKDAVEFTPTGARSFNVYTLAWTDWYIVADDDPRANTIEDAQAEQQAALQPPMEPTE